MKRPSYMPQRVADAILKSKDEELITMLLAARCTESNCFCQEYTFLPRAILSV